MAFRRPLYVSDGNLIEMSDSQIGDIITHTYRKYINNPSVRLEYTSSGGNLGTIYDTRFTKPTGKYSRSRFFTEAETNEPVQISIGYSRITQVLESVTNVKDIDNRLFPLYYTVDGNLRSMSKQDMLDTFIEPAINDLTNGDDTYSVTTSSTKSGYTHLGWIFADTVANAAGYYTYYLNSGINNLNRDIYDTVDVVSYSLKRRAAISLNSYTTPVKFSAVDNEENALQFEPYTESSLGSVLEGLVRYAARLDSEMYIRYNWNGSGSSCGTVTDRRLNGSGRYVTQFVNADDYRSQELPNGVPTAVNTYTLKVSKGAQ